MYACEAKKIKNDCIDDLLEEIYIDIARTARNGESSYMFDSYKFSLGDTGDAMIDRLIAKGYKVRDCRNWNTIVEVSWEE